MMNNWEKIAVILLAFVLIVEFAVFAQKNAAYEELYAMKISRIQEEAGGEARRASFEMPENIMERLDLLLAGVFKAPRDRNIFTAYRSPRPEIVREEPEETVVGEAVLEVIDISYKPSAIEYLGKIIFGDNKLVAQINIGSNSYLVSGQGSFAGYKIEFLSADLVRLIDKQLNKIELKYRAKSLSEELTAKVKDTATGQVINIYKDSEFLGYKVLDIDEEYVLVSKQGEHLKLWKGQVQK